MMIDKEDRYMNACIKYLQKNMECVGYRDYIIERLNKYQMIEQIIMDDWDKGYQHSETIQRIKEVMKNGNNNTDDKLQD